MIYPDFSPYINLNKNNNILSHVPPIFIDLKINIIIFLSAIAPSIDRLLDNPILDLIPKLSLLAKKDRS